MDLYRWLSDGWVALQDRGDLAVALGFRGAPAKVARNRLLRDAAGALAPGKSRWAQAEVLRNAIENPGAFSRDADALQLIRDAQLYGCVPRTERHLYTLLSD